MGNRLHLLLYLRTMLLAGVAALSSAAAQAQNGTNGAADTNAAIVINDVNVTASRLGGNVSGDSGSTPGSGRRPSSREDTAPAPQRLRSTRTPTGGGRTSTSTSGDGTGAAAGPAPSNIITGSVATGASSTVITAADIERSPGHSLQDILSRVIRVFSTMSPGRI